MTMMQEIRDMQALLGIRSNPKTVFDSDCAPCGYQEWLVTYHRTLQLRCQQKLASDFLANLGKDLFQKKFGHFLQFQR